MRRLLPFLALLACALPAQADERIERAAAEVHRIAAAAVAGGAVPGLAYAIVGPGGVVAVEGMGRRQAGRPDPVDGHTAFALASLSKPIAATLIARLVGEDRIEWTTRIADLLPWFSLSDPAVSARMTIADLLSHRSGLPGDAGNDLELFGFDQQTILARLRLVDLDSTGLDRFSYSNFGFTAAAVAAAAATDFDWSTLVSRELFSPLRMSDASARHADGAGHANRAYPHTLIGDGWTAGPLHDADAQAPAGGMTASALDLANFARMLLDGGTFDGTRIVAPDTLAATMTPLVEVGPQPVTGVPARYGLGWFVTDTGHGRRVGHPGASTSGARTLIDLMPEEGLAIVVLVNAYPSGLPEALAETFFDTYFDGAPQKDWAALYDQAIADSFGRFLSALAAPPDTGTVRPAHPLAGYTGTYAHGYLGRVEVARAGDGLVVRLGPAGARTYALTPAGGDAFVYFPLPEMPMIAFPVRFGFEGETPTARHIVVSTGWGDRYRTAVRED